jgi:hypothetical protein
MKTFLFLVAIFCFIISGCSNSTEPEELTAFRNLTGNWETGYYEDGEYIVSANYYNMPINADTADWIIIYESRIKANYRGNNVSWTLDLPGRIEYNHIVQSMTLKDKNHLLWETKFFYIENQDTLRRKIDTAFGKRLK